MTLLRLAEYLFVWLLMDAQVAHANNCSIGPLVLPITVSRPPPESGVQTKL